MTAPPDGSFAAALRRRDAAAIDTLLASAILTRAAMVPRPWGGGAIAAHTGRAAAAQPIGETFELAAAPSDPEAAAHPSLVRLPDGSDMPLGEILHACPQILGEDHVLAFGHELPLLPKLLDVQALLSVQAHPAGHPELYVVIDAEPGATMRLGLREDTTGDELAAELRQGTAAVAELAAFVGDRPDLVLGLTAWLLGDPDAPLGPELAQRCRPATELLARVRGIGRAILGRMHEVAIAPGMVLHNCVPHPATGQPSSTLHALGNPHGRAVLALEIRLCGPTFRAWDHGRLPPRTLDIDGALANVPRSGQRVEDFVVTRGADDFAIDNGVFSAERIAVGSHPITRGGGRPAFVHVLRGTVELRGGDGPITLAAGRSALVPATWSSFAVASPTEASVVVASLTPRATALATRTRALRRVRDLVARSEGPRDVLAIANGGDGPVVTETFAAARRDLFRADGATRVVVHEEATRRGQLLGLIDAMRDWTPTAADDVAIGIMLPGQGTRLSPITQRLHGIKPFVPMPIRTAERGPWLSAGAASLHSWVLVADALRRRGFAGIAWKWGDEPQLPSVDLDAVVPDLREVDAVRFGKHVAITDDLALNKEWLLCAADGHLLAQVRRRPAAALRARLSSIGENARSLVHIGSPALSHRFVRALVAEFGDLAGWLDIDGYLFEALTHDATAWAAERQRDAGLRALLGGCPDFYERAQAVRARLEAERGAPLRIMVIDCGPDTWWGDMGQLGPARDGFARLVRPGAEGEFARRLAAIDDVVPDRFGNRVVASRIPDDGSVRDCVVVDGWLGDGSRAEGAVVLGGELGRARLGVGAVVVDSTIVELEAGDHAWVFRAIAEALSVGAHRVHTTLPEDPGAAIAALQQWSFDTREDPGSGVCWTNTVGDNPGSFRDKAAQMRQRDRPAAAIEAELASRHRAPLAARIRAGATPST